MSLSASLPLLVGFTAPITIAAIGGHQLLAPICADLLYGHGWKSICLWIPLAILSMPLRVADTGRIRATLHALGSGVAWCWWALAILPADLWSRADLLWTAYFTIGVAIICWRCVLHGWLLTRTIRRILEKDPESIAIEYLATGLRRASTAAARSDLRVRWILLLSDLRWNARFAAAHRFLFGPTGASRIALVEAMQSTDRRALEVQRSLPEVGDRLIRSTSRLAAAFTLEARIVAGTRNASPDDGDARFLNRSIGVLRDLSLAEMASGRVEAIQRFVHALRIVGDGPILKSRTLALFERTTRAGNADVAAILRDVNEAARLSDIDAALLETSCVVMLVRLRVFRIAKARLGFWSDALRARRGAGGSVFEEQCEVLASALASEVEHASVPVARKTDEPGFDRIDLEAIERRKGQARRLGRTGRHPRHGGATRPSDFGILPIPIRPREIGVGLLATVAAAICWIASLCLVSWWPLTERSQVVFDVPFGGEVASQHVGAAVVAGASDDPFILLATDEVGVRSFAVGSMRMKAEGGPGTALDGVVRKLGTNADGSVVAIFKASADQSACISIRRPSGAWEPVIGPTELSVDGEDIEAAIDGLGVLCLLRSTPGVGRLLLYNEELRALHAADCHPTTEIVGSFVDSSSGRPAETLLLTDDSSSPLYRISKGGTRSELVVDAVEAPPLAAGRKAVAVAALPDGGAAVVDSMGGCWVRSGHSADWQSRRAGAQGLELDAIDRILVSADGSRLWLLRDGVVRSRELPDASRQPAAEEGWISTALEGLELDRPSDRLAMAEIDGYDGVVVVQPSATEDARGFALAVRAHRDAGVQRLEVTSLLEDSQRLVECDHDDGTLVLHIEAREGPARAVYRTLTRVKAEPVEHLRLDAIRRTAVTDSRGPVRLSDRILGLHHSVADRSVLLLGDGQWFRFSSSTDAILDEMGRDGGSPESVDIANDAIDAALLLEESEPRRARVLRATGSVDDVPLGDQAPAGTLVVDANDGIPANVAKDAVAAFTSSNGVVLVSPREAWRLALDNAGDPWQDLTAGIGAVATDAVIGVDCEGRPSAAWLREDGSGRLLVDQRFIDVNPRAFDEHVSGFSQILPGIGTPYFARTRGLSALVALDRDGGIKRVLRSTRSGPEDIVGTHLRDGFADFLSSRSLHSLSLATGDWSVSQVLGETCEILRSGEGAEELLLVVPADRAGIPRGLRSGEDASRLRPLAAAGPLRSIVPLGSGVAGFDAEDSLAWVSIQDQRLAKIPSRAVDGMALPKIAEAVARGERIWLRGADEDSERIVSYPIAHQKAAERRIEGLSAISVASTHVFALGRSGVSALDPASLADRGLWRISPNEGQIVLGTSESDRGVVLKGRELCVLDPARPGAFDTVLAAADASESTNPFSAERVAALGSRLTVFTKSGAWSREARPTTPFVRLPNVNSVPEAIVRPPEGAWPWILVDGNWVSLPDGQTRAERSIGWLPPQRLVVADRERRGVRVDGMPLSAFVESPVKLGAPFGLAQLSDDQALVFGRDNAAVFDAGTQTWMPAPELLQGFTSSCAVLDIAPGRLVVQQKGVVVETINGKAATLFGGKRVRNAILAPASFAIDEESGTIVDVSGQALANQRSAGADMEAAVVAAASDGQSVYRVLDGSRNIQSINSSSLAMRTLPGEADEIAPTALGILCFDRQKRRLFAPEGEFDEKAKHWIASRGASAYVDETDSVWIIPKTIAIAVKAVPAADPLPGKLIANIPDSTASLFERSDGGFGLYDVETGRVLAASLEGTQPQIGDDAVFMIDTHGNGSRILRHSTMGSTSSPGGYDSVLVQAGDQCVTLLAMRWKDDKVLVDRLDPKTLLPDEVALYEDSPLLPSSEEPLRLARLSGGALILFGRSRMLLDDGVSMTVIPNPHQDASLRLAWDGLTLTAIAPDGRSCGILTRRDGALLPIPEPKPEFPTATRIDWKTVLRVPIATEPAGPRVQITGGTLDTRSGWILENRPMRLVVEGGEVRVKSQARSVPLTGIKSCVERVKSFSGRLSTVQDELYIEIDKIIHRLGRPTEGEILDGHRVLKAAPLGDDRCIWIDALGQLWWGSEGKRKPLPGGSNARDFLVDASDQLHIRCKAGDYRVLDGNRPAIQVSDGRDLFAFGGRAPGSCASIQWKTGAGSNAPLLWSWKPMSPEGAPPIGLRSTLAGFSIPRFEALELRNEKPVAVLRIGGSSLLVAIKNGELRWNETETELADAHAAQPQPSRQLLRNIKIGRGALRVQDSRLDFLVGDTVYPYVEEWSRFRCSICTAATARGTELITAAEGARHLLRWEVDGRGVARLMDAPIALPADTTEVVALAPGFAADEVVATVQMLDGSQRRFSGSKGGWIPDPSPRFVSDIGTRWNWDSSKPTKVMLDRQIVYNMLGVDEPRLDCDVIEPELDNAGRPIQESLHATENGFIRYRGHAGRWFEVREGMMPLPIVAPGPRPTSYRTQFLDIDRFRNSSSNSVSPLARIRFETGEPVEFPLEIEDGVLTGLDRWSAETTLHAEGPERIHVVVNDTVVRPVQLVADGIEMLRPARAEDFVAEPESLKPRTQLGDVDITMSGELRIAGNSLGTATPMGFPVLDPDLLLPIAFEQRKLTAVTRDGRFIHLESDSPIRSFRVLGGVGDCRDLRPLAWQQIAGRLEPVVTCLTKDGVKLPFLIDRETWRLQPTHTSAEELPCFGRFEPQFPIAARDGSRLWIRREGQRNLDISCSLEDGEVATFEHTDALRITTGPGWIRTHGTKWMTLYADEDGDGRWSLESVGPIDPIMSPAREVSLGNGLHARREQGVWEIRLGADPSSPRWPITALGAPARVYVGTPDVILEVGPDWSRTTSMDGRIALRSVNELPSALASTEAYRCADGVAAANERYTISLGESIKVRVESSAPPPGRWSSAGAGPWHVSLDRAGASCEIRYAGELVTVVDGALDLDYAVAIAALDDDVLLADRASVSLLSGVEHRWTRHDPAIGSLLRSAPPIRTTGVALDRRIERCIGVMTPTAKVLLGYMLEPSPRMLPLDSTELRQFWSRSPNIELGIDERDRVWIRRIIGGKPFEYPSLPRREACSVGRLAFDEPLDLFLAQNPATAKTSTCIEMRLGWEWIEDPAEQSASGVVMSRPTPVSPEYGSRLNPTWLDATDLNGRAAELRHSLGALAGEPVLWYPHEDRLFLVGERNAVWFELGWRWRGRRGGD